MEKEKNGLAIVSIVLAIIGFLLNTTSDSAMQGFAILLTLIAIVFALISIFRKECKKSYAIVGIIFCFLSFFMFNHQTKIDSDVKSNAEAYWNEYNSRSFVITFDTNGGQEIEAMTVHPNTYLNPVVPSKEGYEFKYWTLDGAIFDFSGYVNDRITSDITLKANYMKKETRGANPDTFNNSNNSNKQPSTNNNSNNNSSNNQPSNNNTSTSYGYQEIYNEYSQKLIKAGPTSSISEMAKICNQGVSEMARYMYSAPGTDGQYATYESWASKLYDVYINNCR